MLYYVVECQNVYGERYRASWHKTREAADRKAYWYRNSCGRKVLGILVEHVNHAPPREDRRVIVKSWVLPAVRDALDAHAARVGCSRTAAMDALLRQALGC